MSVAILVFLLLFLVFSSGYFAASETALFSLSDGKVKALRSDANKKNRLVAALLQHPRDLLVTVFMLNTLINILLQNVASHMFGNLASWTLKVGFPLVITLIFGEIIPKYIGLQNNLSISCRVAPLINFFQNILKPVRKLTISITAPISRLFFFFLKKEESISKEELQHVLKTSELYGVLNEIEAEIVWGYLNLQDSIVKEFMQPREDVHFYDVNDPLTKLTYLLGDQQYNRIPVCKGDLQNILGVITSRVFFFNRTKLTSPDKIIPILSKPYYVPENTLAHVLLHRFEKENMYFAVVVDEYGSVSGIITREDLLEVVIGKMYDAKDENSIYTKAGKNEIITSGKLELNLFNDIFNVNFESPNNMVTIGGWITEKIGDIAKSGSKIELDGFLFHVLAADPTKIKRLYIRKLSSLPKIEQRRPE